MHHRTLAAGAGLLAALAPLAAHAHVKWFAAFSFADKPRSMAELISPLVIGLTLLTAAVMAALVWADRWLTARGWLARIESALAGHKQHSTLIMRIAIGATMLMTWQSDAVLAPEIREADFGALGGVLGWSQFVIALLLLLPATTPLAGAALLALYAACTARLGMFHMLDYLHLIGAGVYLLLTGVANLRVRAIRLPMLYATVGFALMWLGLEKLFYPQWGRLVLADNPQLTLGLDPLFFLTSAAFVELALGFLLIICLLQRPLSLVITLVFVMTTLVFGKVEIIGHTALHAALVVFLLNGPGTVYRAPITLHTRLPLRMAFAAVNFALGAGVLAAAYALSADAQYRAHVAQLPRVTLAQAPALNAAITGDALDVTFGPGFDGVAHVFVDGAFAGATHGEPLALSGHAQMHRVTVALHDAGHRQVWVDDAPVAQDLLWRRR